MENETENREFSLEMLSQRTVQENIEPVLLRYFCKLPFEDRAHAIYEAQGDYHLFLTFIRDMREEDQAMKPAQSGEAAKTVTDKRIDKLLEIKEQATGSKKRRMFELRYRWLALHLRKRGLSDSQIAIYLEHHHRFKVSPKTISAYLRVEK